jgi:hypothetical protein
MLKKEQAYISTLPLGHNDQFYSEIYQLAAGRLRGAEIVAIKGLERKAVVVVAVLTVGSSGRLVLL